MSETMEKLGNTLSQDVGEREEVEAEMWRRRVMLSSCPGFLHRSKLLTAEARNNRLTQLPIIVFWQLCMGIVFLEGVWAGLMQQNCRKLTARL